MIKTIDNFLDQKDFMELQNVLFGENFPWYYNDYKINSTYEEKIKSNNFQFVHTFYNDYGPISPYVSIIEPIILKLNPAALIRIKANLTTKTDSIYEFGMHQDFTFNNKTAVYYLNSNNGYTFFEDGTKIDSVENRLVIFDANLIHSGTTCTDEKRRCVLNINYF